MEKDANITQIGSETSLWPYLPVRLLIGWFVGWMVGLSVCHDFLKGREVSLGALVFLLRQLEWRQKKRHTLSQGSILGGTRFFVIMWSALLMTYNCNSTKNLPKQVRKRPNCTPLYPWLVLEPVWWDGVAARRRRLGAPQPARRRRHRPLRLSQGLYP